MKKYLVIGLTFALAMVLYANPVHAWISGEGYRTNITIDNTNGNDILRDYQVPINITYSDKMKYDFSDIRFTWYNKTNATELNVSYWLFNETDSTSAFVYVRMPYIGSNTNETLYVYYNMTTNSASSGTNTCYSYEDFESGSYDTNSWGSYQGVLAFNIVTNVTHDGLKSLYIESYGDTHFAPVRNLSTKATDRGRVVFWASPSTSQASTHRTYLGSGNSTVYGSTIAYYDNIEYLESGWALQKTEWINATGLIRGNTTYNNTVYGIINSGIGGVGQIMPLYETTVNNRPIGYIDNFCYMNFTWNEPSHSFGTEEYQSNPPIFVSSSTSPISPAIVPVNSISFTVSWLNANNVWINHDLTGIKNNYTMSNSTPTVFTYSYNAYMQSGTYNYTLYANNTNGESSSIQQYLVVSAIVDNCTATTNDNTAITFTIYDEVNRTKINGTLEVDMQAYINGSSTQMISNVSTKFTNNDTYRICVYPSYVNLSIDMLIKSSETNYRTRYYNYYRERFNSSFSSQIPIYLIGDSVGTLTKLTVKDGSNNPYTGTYATVRRYYPDIGSYGTVSSPITDTNGETNTYLELYNTEYEFRIYQTGILLQTYTKRLLTSDEITLIVNPSTALPYLEYWNIQKKCIYYESLGQIRCEYSDNSGYLNSMRLEVVRRGALIMSPVCDYTNATKPSGTFVCNTGNITGGGIYSYAMTATLNDGTEHLLLKEDAQGNAKTSFLFGNCSDPLNMGGCLEGAVMAFILTLSAAAIGFYNPTISIVFGLAGIIATYFLGLIAITFMSLIGMVFVAGIVIFAIYRSSR